jgi:hypothetical protein
MPITDLLLTGPFDPEDAQRLRAMIGGPGRARNLAARHPLRSGLAALEQFERRGALALNQRVALYSLGAVAGVLFRHEADWEEHETELVAKLRSTKESPYVLFELNVGLHALEPHVEASRWRTFEEAAPDWRTEGPDCDVECKLADSGAKAQDYGGYLTLVARQHPRPAVPLMAAIGFNEILDPSTRQTMANEAAKRTLPWMTQHPHVAGALVFGQTGQLREGRGPGGRGVFYDGQKVVEIRNHLATPRLDPSFRFGRGYQTFAAGHTGPVTSLRDLK